MARDPKIETWLSSFKIPFEYRDDFPLAAIVIDRQAKENIRLTERLDEDTVIRYGIALDNGADFPGVVLYPLPPVPSSNGTATHGLIGGWHRTEAFRLADRTTIPAYIAHVSDQLLISVLRRTANVMEGKPPSAAEALEQAVYLVRQGYTLADAARLEGVSMKRLNDRWLYEEVRGRLVKGGVDLAQVILPPSAMARLSQVRDRHLKPLVELAHEARLPTDRITELARLVREAQSDEDADAVRAEWRETSQTEIQRNRGGTVRAPGSAIRRLPLVLKQAEKLMAVHGSDQAVAVLTPADLRALIGACRRTVAELQAMISRLEGVTQG